jgi:hypothetical protein
VSTQVLQALAVNLRKKARKPLDTRATREVVSDYLAWQVVVNGATFGEEHSVLELVERDHGKEQEGRRDALCPGIDTGFTFPDFAFRSPETTFVLSRPIRGESRSASPKWRPEPS